MAEADNSRIVWIDAVKGLAIALVVFGHVLGGILARGWLDPQGLGAKIYNFIYLFHMPVFFMVSGLLLREAAASRPLYALVSRMGSILWPYLLWAAIALAVFPITRRYTSFVPGDFELLSWLKSVALGEFSWFLWTLFVVQAIYIGLARVPIWALLLVSVLASALFANASFAPLNRVAEFMPFLLLGVILQPFRDILSIDGRTQHLLASLLVYVGIALAVAAGWAQSRLISALCGVAGIFATIALAQCVSERVQGRILAPLGIASLAVFLLHPYFQGASRLLALSAFGIAPWLQLVVQTVAAILGPFLFWILAERIGAGWLFRLRLGTVERRSA